ncbi:MAG: tRNA-binding protein [Actinomycetota bacterium]|nr:tRNA-binding protein [Actinomycetota bacterium]
MGEQSPERLPRKPDVGMDAFAALDLRVGRVVDVQEFPEARTPAWKLTVDFGPTVGTLGTSAQVRGYTREELTGRLVVGAVNLGDKRIAGFTSQFLVLGALAPGGAVHLLHPDDPGPRAPAGYGDRPDPGVPPGAPVG